MRRLGGGRGAASALEFPQGPVSDRAGTPYVLSGIELATSFVMGVDPARASLEPTRTSPSELPGVLERALLSALQRAPCIVAFSGGRDSAGLLAAAVHAARRHGLPLPVPATYRFPGAEGVDEAQWQDAVVGHLKIEDWVRVDVTDELDLIGPVAAPLLRRFGPLWPPNSHFAGLLVPHAKGGTLVTGVGGDELLEPSAPRLAQLLTRRQRPRRSDLRTLAAAVAPTWLRARRASRHIAPLPWLVPSAAAAYVRARAVEGLGPLWWGRSVTDVWWRSRQRAALVASIAAACGDDVTVEHPFMNPSFLSAAAGAMWRVGFATRAAAMELLFGNLLPQKVRQRSDKAAFFVPYVNRYSRAFIESWDGSGVDEGLVNADVLQRCWNEDRVDARSYALLQSTWLASENTARSRAIPIAPR